MTELHRERIRIKPDFRVEALAGKEAIIRGRIDHIAIVEIEGLDYEPALLPEEYEKV